MARDCPSGHVGIVPHQRFGILKRRGLVNEKRAAAIAERPPRYKLAFVQKPRRLLPVHRPQRGNLLTIVSDVVHELHLVLQVY